MQAELRGKIFNEARARQLVDFSGLRYGKITPTDIDGFQINDNDPQRIRGAMDFGGKFFIFYEFKVLGVVMPYGQRMHLEFLTNAISVPTLVIVATHDMPVEMPIPAADCYVSEIRFRNEWRPPKSAMTVRALVDGFRNYMLKAESAKRLTLGETTTITVNV